MAAEGGTVEVVSTHEDTESQPQEENPQQIATEETPKDDPPAQDEPTPGAETEEEEEEEPDDGVPKVLVTGASGYIAQHLIKQLLEQGRYHVRGSVRNKKKEEKVRLHFTVNFYSNVCGCLLQVKPLLDLVPDAKYPLRLVEAELQNAQSWAKAVKGCSYVFHMASPFYIEIPKDEQMMIRPAVEGTVNVLQACADAGTVKRVILTSSVAAVSSGMIGNPGNPPDYVYTDRDWSDEVTCLPYEKSKLKAEQAAWDFMKKLSEDKQFELVVMNPGFVQGPILTKIGGGSSRELCQQILSGGMPLIPDNAFAIVDVRDVAAAHIAGLEKSEAAGKRYILVSETVHLRDIAHIIFEEFRVQGYKPPTKNMPNIMLWGLTFFKSSAKLLYKNRGKHNLFNNEPFTQELGVQPRPVKESVIENCYSLIEFGFVKKTPSYLGHPSTRPPPEQPAEPTPEQPAEPTPEQPAEPTPQQPAEPTPEQPAEPTPEQPANSKPD